MSNDFSDQASVWNLPESLAEALSEGQSRLKAVREWRGMTCSQLSDSSGVDLVLLMMAERGSDLLPEEWLALAHALGVEVSLLAPTPVHRLAQRNLDRHPS